MPKRKQREDEEPTRKRQFLGRVANRSKVKHVKVLNIGELVVKEGWYNAGYIFPKGYSALIEYKDISDPNTRSLYHCEILDGGSKPIFRITSEKLGSVFTGKSPTACWKQILDQINETLKANDQAIVKTQVAGPEYFGLNDPVIVEAIETLDPKKMCHMYWTEKEKILEARKDYEVSHPKGERKIRKRKDSFEEQVDLTTEESFKENYTGIWSTIQRKERYINRLVNMGQDVNYEDDNPMPDHQDPITLQPVVVPALSPYGHVAGYYTWTQALRESGGKCPFTKQPLSIERLIKLTKQNYCLYKDNIIF
ncbi:hypothetical protein SteCoe_34279 [Stentor coeruleus]|uniref:FYR N-terminal domain-containing protein n=1 Tax=Stentor coeruleus TaxID=5963 RepID=A0A1R2AV92_9CILI|nr:hypothetical protein SteCoe_34279 [Stentor coeruleus]